MIQGNVLGDIRAEHDSNMLDVTFWETSDYKSLLESYDKPIVVGRRGTGKSALAYMLSKYWATKKNTTVLKIAPEEEQIIGLRDTFEQFGEKYLHIKAGTKMAWRYAIYMEVITDLVNHYKFKNNIDINSIKSHITSWGSRRQSIASKIRKKLKSIYKKDESCQSRIADLADELQLDLIEEVLFEALEKSNTQYIIFADKLDEGYSPDNLGVAIVDGFVQAVIDIKSHSQEKIVAFAFVRDNIYRAISKLDPDFTRNIEGQTLRLHWDEYNLFNLVCNRMKFAFKDDVESNIKVWNKFTAKGLKGKEGFRAALKLTLYRPRDILVLLNQAYLYANSQDRKEIIIDDIEVTAKTISINRLNDLHKEYDIIFPAIEEFTTSFHQRSPELSVETALNIVEKTLLMKNFTKEKQQDIYLFENGNQVIHRLYSVGFLGIYNEKSTSYIFCHDGKDPDRDFLPDTKLLLHPCYWLALGSTQSELKLDEAEDIHDEYDIEVSSVSSEQRNQRIGGLLQELTDIPEGFDGAQEFEAWCLKSLKIIFAGVLSNIEMHPNKNGLQQRDIVATNLSTTNLWKRIFEDYDSRQVVFEVKNFKELKAAEYRQINSYLCNEYGRIGFIVTRDHTNNLEKHRELQWAKELYNDHKKIVIKISSKFIEKHLSKVRSPKKHDAVEKELNNLLDTYIRNYFTNKCK